MSLDAKGIATPAEPLLELWLICFHTAFQLPLNVVATGSDYFVLSGAVSAAFLTRRRNILRLKGNLHDLFITFGASPRINKARFAS